MTSWSLDCEIISYISLYFYVFFWNNKKNFIIKRFLFDVVKDSKHLKYVIADIYSKNVSPQEILPLSQLNPTKAPTL